MIQSINCLTNANFITEYLHGYYFKGQEHNHAASFLVKTSWKDYFCLALLPDLQSKEAKSSRDLANHHLLRKYNLGNFAAFVIYD